MGNWIRFSKIQSDFFCTLHFFCTLRRFFFTRCKTSETQYNCPYEFSRWFSFPLYKCTSVVCKWISRASILKFCISISCRSPSIWVVELSVPDNVFAGLVNFPGTIFDALCALPYPVQSWCYCCFIRTAVTCEVLFDISKTHSRAPLEHIFVRLRLLSAGLLILYKHLLFAQFFIHFICLT